MSIPESLNNVFKNLPVNVQTAVSNDYEKRCKSLSFSFLAWFCLGWHYLYLKRPGLQFAFWFTGGGCCVWWFIDLFRITGMVNKLNEDIARELIVQHKTIQSSV